MSEIGKKVGGRIAALRKRAEMTQRDLADKIGTSPEVVSRMEHGVNAPSLERLAEIAEALGAMPRDLLDFDESARGEQAERGARVTAALRRLSSEDADLLVGLADLMRRRKRR